MKFPTIYITPLSSSYAAIVDARFNVFFCYCDFIFCWFGFSLQLINSSGQVAYVWWV